MATAPRVRNAAVGAPPGAPLLPVDTIEVVHHSVVLVLKGVSLTAPRGGITGFMGGNGAGKTMTPKAILNLRGAARGEVVESRITPGGEDVAHLTPHRTGQARHRPGDGRAPLRRAPHDRSEPAHRGLHPKGRRRGGPPRPRAGRRLCPAPEGPSARAGGLALRWRAADVDHPSRADGGTDRRPPGRAVDGPRTPTGRGDRRDRGAAEPRGRRHLPARGVEYQHRLALRARRLHSGKRTCHAGSPGGHPTPQRGRQGVLSWPQFRGAAELPRHQELQAPQTSALAPPTRRPSPSWGCRTGET